MRTAETREKIMPDSFNLSPLLNQKYSQFLQRSRIKVLLVNTGGKHDGSEDSLELLDLFQAINTFPLDQLDFTISSGDAGKTQQPLALVNNSYRNGWIQLEYVSSITEDLLKNSGFYYSQQPQALIHLIHLDQHGLTQAVLEKYQTEVKQIREKCPSILQWKCFAFESAETNLSTTTHDVTDPTVVIIPRQRKSQIILYLNTFLAAFVVELVRRLSDRLPLISSLTVSDVSPPPAATGSPSSQMKPLANSSKREISVLSLGSLDDSSENPISTILTSAINLPEPTANTEPPSEQTISKKRHSARLQKITADMYLMLGCWQKAGQLYQSILDQLESGSDFCYLGSSRAGILIADLLCILSDLSVKNEHLYDASKKQELDDERLVQYLAKFQTEADEVDEAFEESGHVYLKTCFHLDMAELLCTMNLLTANSNVCQIAQSPVNDLIQRNVDLSESLIQPGQLRLDASVGQLISSNDVNAILMKTWDIDLVSLSIDEQLNTISRLAKLFTMIGYRRKSAFFMRQLLLVLSSVIGDHDGSQLRKHGPIVLRLIMALLKSYGIIETREPEADVQKGKYGQTCDNRGWPSIKLQLLTDTLLIADKLAEYHYIAYFLLLKLELVSRLDDTVYSSERVRLMHSLKTVAYKLTFHNQKHIYQASLPTCLSLHDALHDVDYFNILSSINGVRGSCKLSNVQLYPQPIISSDTLKLPVESATENPFIYNPYDKKGQNASKPAAVAVRGESLFLDVIVKCNLSIELRIDQCALILADTCEGVTVKLMNSLPVQLHRQDDRMAVLRFSVTPNNGYSPASLRILGCLIKFESGWFEYFLFNLNVRDATQLSLNSIFDVPKALENVEGGLTVAVVEPLPLLKIFQQSVHLQNNRLLILEGETVELEIVIQNCNATPLGYLDLSCSEERDENEFVSNAIVVCKGSEIETCNTTFTISVSVTGVSSLTSGQIHILYGIQKSITRHLDICFDISVQAVLQIENVDIFRDRTGEDGVHVDDCLLIVDAKNIWSAPVSVSFDTPAINEDYADLTKLALSKYQPSFQGGPATMVYPNETKRLMIPVHQIDFQTLLQSVMTKHEVSTDLFIIPKIKNDPIKSLPAIPVLQSKQYANEKQVKYTAAIEAFVKVLKKRGIKYEDYMKKRLPKSEFTCELQTCRDAIRVEYGKRKRYWLSKLFANRNVVGMRYELNADGNASSAKYGRLAFNECLFRRDTLCKISSSQVKFEITVKNAVWSPSQQSYQISLKQDPQIIFEVKSASIMTTETIIVRMQAYQDFMDQDRNMIYDMTYKLSIPSGNCQFTIRSNESRLIPIHVLSIGKFKFLFQYQRVDIDNFQQLFHDRNQMTGWYSHGPLSINVTR